MSEVIPTEHGLRWGPLEITLIRNSIMGADGPIYRGYDVEILTDTGNVLVHVSELGRVLRAFPHPKDGRNARRKREAKGDGNGE